MGVLQRPLTISAIGLLQTRTYLDGRHEIRGPSAAAWRQKRIDPADTMAQAPIRISGRVWRLGRWTHCSTIVLPVFHHCFTLRYACICMMQTVRKMMQKITKVMLFDTKALHFRWKSLQIVTKMMQDLHFASSPIHLRPIIIGLSHCDPHHCRHEDDA